MGKTYVWGKLVEKIFPMNPQIQFLFNNDNSVGLKYGFDSRNRPRASFCKYWQLVHHCKAANTSIDFRFLDNYNEKTNSQTITRVNDMLIVSPFLLLEIGFGLPPAESKKLKNHIKADPCYVFFGPALWSPPKFYGPRSWAQQALTSKKKKRN